MRRRDSLVASSSRRPQYWFLCADVDGDGKLSPHDMRGFYEEQMRRMECLGHEPVPFPDMLCQMIDIIKPQNDKRLVTQDFLDPVRIGSSGALFDALFSLDRFVAFEQRDPFYERMKREDAFTSEWDRFAAAEYARLSSEEAEG